MPIRQRGSPAKNVVTCPRRSALRSTTRPVGIDRVHLEHLLGQIEADRGNLIPWMAPLPGDLIATTWHADAVRGPSTWGNRGSELP